MLSLILLTSVNPLWNVNTFLFQPFSWMSSKYLQTESSPNDNITQEQEYFILKQKYAFLTLV